MESLKSEDYDEHDKNQKDQYLGETLKLQNHIQTQENSKSSKDDQNDSSQVESLVFKGNSALG